MTDAVVASPVRSGLSLSRRQRAMLKEMGISVWQPLSAVPTASAQVQALQSNTINSGAVSARITRATGTFQGNKQPVQLPETLQSVNPAAGVEGLHLGTSAWRVGKLQTLYPETATDQAARWLLLIESPASALEGNFNPFEGDAGTLLDNMLRAAKLHTATALLAPLIRGQSIGGDADMAATSASSAGLIAELADTFASAKADVVLVIGRLAAQAVLQSTEPLAKLRGHIHALHNTPTIITLELAYLLRNPLEKAKAWDDLCLAISASRVTSGIDRISAEPAEPS